MHLLTLSEPVNLGKTLGILEKGDWLMHDLNAFEIAQKAPRGTALVEHTKIKTNFSGPPFRDASLIMRSGAIGDLLLLTPVLKEWRKRNSGELHLCCFAHHFPLFDGTKLVDALKPYPFPVSEINAYYEIVSLENTMETHHELHATDAFSDKLLGIDERVSDYRPIYRVTNEEKAATAKHLFTGRPNIVIQQRASVANRDYPLELWLEVIVKLERKGWGVLLVGHKGQLPNIPRQHQSPFIRDLSRLDLSFRETAAVLAQAQAFCGVDSAWAHMCHALDIPAVVLFGPFSWQTRTSKAPKTIALSGVGECAPCSWHMHAGQMFPPNKPCTAIQRCVVLADIPVERVLSKIDLLKP